MEEQTVVVDGIRQHWVEEGTGQPVVLIHGIPTGPRLWRDVIPRLRGARMLAWEMVGYGSSITEGRGHDISVARQADYLTAWMRAIGLQQAILVGHDLGGGVAQNVAVRSPELVRGLVLMNCIAYDSWPIPSVKAMRALGAVVERLPTPLFRLIFGLFLTQGHTSRAGARAAMAEHWPPYAVAGGAAAFIHQVRSLHVQDTLAVAGQLPHLTVPTRLAWGTADRFQKIGYGYRLAHDLKARLDRIEGGKHFVPEDDAEAVAVTVNALLDEVAPQR